jgi:hypothetical protein
MNEDIMYDKQDKIYYCYDCGNVKVYGQLFQAALAIKKEKPKCDFCKNNMKAMNKKQRAFYEKFGTLMHEDSLNI